MAISEKHRSTLYNGLGTLLNDHDAVGDLLSNITTRELDELATREFVAAQVQMVRTEIEGVHTKIAESESRLTKYVHKEVAGTRTEVAGTRTEVAGFRGEIGQLRTGFDQRLDAMAANIARTNQWMIGLVVTLVLGLLATQLMGA